MSRIFEQQAITGQLIAPARGARHLSLGVRLADPLKLDPAIGLSESLALACHCKAVIAQRRMGLVVYQFQLQARYWLTITARDIQGTGVGVTEGHQQVRYAFDPPHAGLFGTTRSGKSCALDTILRGLLITNPPHELGLILCDPHADHGMFEQAAHLLLPPATTLDQIGRALEYAGQLLAQRREANRRDAPRVIVAVDEAQSILSDARNLAIVRALAAEAAKFRIHLLLATQKPMERYMPGILTNIGQRWVFLVEDARTSAEVTGQAGLNAHRLTPHGDCLYVAGEAQRLQVALMQERDFEPLERGGPDTWPDPDPEREDTPRLLNMPPLEDRPGPGRPATAIDPVKAAYYYHYGPDAISIAQAAGALHLSRRAHGLHKTWVEQFTEAKAKLEEATTNGDN